MKEKFGKLLRFLDLITLYVYAGTGVQRVKPYNPARTPSDCIVLATGLNFFNLPRLLPINQGEDDDAEEVFQEEGDGDGVSTDEVIDFLKEQLKEYGKVKYVHVPRWVFVIWGISKLSFKIRVIFWLWVI